MAIRITCINKNSGNHESPLVAISHLGWVEEGTSNSGKNTRLEIYDWIKEKNGVAYVKDSLGNKAYLMTAVSARGNKYVKTVADETKTDNLLSLVECK